MEALIAIPIAVFGIIGVVAGLSILRAWVLIKLWGWFIVPVFHLPDLNIPLAIGLCLVVGMFTATMKSEKVNWLGAILAPFITLFMGWIVKSFI